MSGTAKYIRSQSISLRTKEFAANIDWYSMEALASEELGGAEQPVFSDKVRCRIYEILSVSNDYKTCKRIELSRLKDMVNDIEDLLSKGVPESYLRENINQILCPIYLRVFEEALAQTLDMFDASIKARIKEYKRLLRLSSNEVTFGFPRAESYAAYEIGQVFAEIGLSAAARHTFPTSVEEGSEPLSVFQQFVFKHVMPDIGSDPSAQKILYRRMREAERACKSN